MSQPLTFTYTNWRGETGERRVIPGAFRFASTEWHPEPQWLLVAFDLDRCQRRDFAVKDIVFASVSDTGIQAAMTRVIADMTQQPAHWIVTETETGQAIISTDVEERAHRIHRQHDGSILTPLYTHPAPAQAPEGEPVARPLTWSRIADDLWSARTPWRTDWKIERKDVKGVLWWGFSEMGTGCSSQDFNAVLSSADRHYQRIAGQVLAALAPSEKQKAPGA